MPLSGWQGIVSALGPTYRAIRFDPPGSGGSDDPGRSLSVADMARTAEALLEALSVGRALLVAASMGGFTALEMALRRPSSVEGMVLFGVASRLEGQGRFQIETWRRLRREGVSPESLLRLQLGATLPPVLFADPGRLEAMIAFFLAHRDVFGQSDEGFLAQSRACLDFDRDDRLGEIAVPALLVAGGEDRIVRPEEARALHRCLRESRFEILPDGGHALAATESSAMARMIAAFAASI